MNLSKYLESMKNLPDRFSNLAFWRGVRKLRDEIVKTFEYLDSWGKNIENAVFQNTTISTLTKTLSAQSTMQEHFKVTTHNNLSWLELDFTSSRVRIENDIENVNVLSAVALAELNLGNYPSISVTLPIIYQVGVGFDLSCDHVIRIPLPVLIAPTYIPSAKFTIYYSHK